MFPALAISGGAGFIGRALVSTYAAQGRVLSIVHGNGCRVDGNLIILGSDHPDLPAYLGSVRVFIHAAGRLKGTPAELEQANPGIVRHFLGLLSPDIEYILHLSSANVLFASQTPYGASKLHAEQVWQSSPLAGRVAMLRPTLVYGPGDWHNIGPLLRLVERFPILPVPSGGRIRPVYVDDLVDLIQALVRQQACAAQQALLVSGNEVTSFPDLVTRLSACLGKRCLCLPLPPPLLTAAGSLAAALGCNAWQQRLAGFQMDKTAHDPAAWNWLGRPPTPLEEGLRRCVRTYQSSL